MTTAPRLFAAAALMTASSAAFAGRVEANLDNGEFTVTCNESCAVQVLPVGSRIHVFDVTGLDQDRRVDEGYVPTKCDEAQYAPGGELPRRIFTEAAADVHTVVLDGSNDNDHFVAIDLDADVVVWAGDGADILVVEGSNTWASMADGGDCAALIDMEFGEVYGRAGNDTLYGIMGTFHMYGGDGRDTIETDEGDDFVKGDAGDDTIDTGAGNDIVYGGDDDDDITTGTGDDEAYGELGADVIDVGEGNDTAGGGKGGDTIYGGQGDDDLMGGRGDDTIKDSYGANNVWGGRDDDTITVTSSGSVVSGSGGTDACKQASGVTLSYCESTF